MTMDEQTLSTEQGKYVLLRADKLRLLMPQTEIDAIEHLDSQPQPSEIPCFLTMPDGGDTCYLVLSDDFTLLETCPDDRFVTTRITTEEGMETEWCWSETRVLQDFTPEIYEIPAILLNTASPLRQYTLMDNQPVFVCSSYTLQQLLLGVEHE